MDVRRIKGRKRRRETMDRWLDGWIETPRDQETERGKEMRSMNAGSGALNDCRHDGRAETP